MKEIPNYPGYFITIDGKIFSRRKYTKAGHWLKIYCSARWTNGYRVVQLWHNGKPKKFSVARLILLTYMPIAHPDAYEACHVNHVRTDDRLENLRWGSRQENMAERWQRAKDFDNQGEFF